jgi:hypothetical protein
MKHVYRYLHGVRTAPHNTKLSSPGYKFRLRRDDGKLVYVSNKRLQQLHDEKRIVTALSYETGA